MSSASDSRQRLSAIAAIVFIALLGIIAFLLWNKSQLDSEVKVQNEEILENERLQVELEKQYYEALSELESMKTGNEELNSLIDTQKQELKDQRNKIKRLIKEGKSGKLSIDSARQEIAKLKSQLEGYIENVNDLKVENENLQQQNTQLATTNQNLSQDLTTSQTKNETLVRNNQELNTVKEDLEVERQELSAVVTKASVVQVIDVSASAWKVRKSGKPAKTKVAAKTDRLKVCFTTTSNSVAVAGIEDFYVRVINPLGETMAIENLGSGILKTASDEDLRYTQIKDLPYENNAVVGCFLWEPNTPFKSGKYDIEVFNKGHLAGKGNFDLR